MAQQSAAGWWSPNKLQLRHWQPRHAWAINSARSSRRLWGPLTCAQQSLGVAQHGALPGAAPARLPRCCLRQGPDWFGALRPHPTRTCTGRKVPQARPVFSAGQLELGGPCTTAGTRCSHRSTGGAGPRRPALGQAPGGLRSSGGAGVRAPCGGTRCSAGRVLHCTCRRQRRQRHRQPAQRYAG